MKIHDEVLGLGVPVPDLALVAVRVPGHALRDVSVVLVLGDQLVILVILRGRAILERLPQDHRGLAGPGDGRGPGDGAVAGHGRVVLDAGQGVGRVKVVVMDAGGHGGALFLAGVGVKELHGDVVDVVGVAVLVEHGEVAVAVHPKPVLCVVD